MPAVDCSCIQSVNRTIGAFISGTNPYQKYKETGELEETTN